MSFEIWSNFCRCLFEESSFWCRKVHIEVRVHIEDRFKVPEIKIESELSIVNCHVPEDETKDTQRCASMGLEGDITACH